MKIIYLALFFLSFCHAMQKPPSDDFLVLACEEEFLNDEFDLDEFDKVLQTKLEFLQKIDALAEEINEKQEKISKILEAALAATEQKSEKEGS